MHLIVCKWTLFANQNTKFCCIMPLPKHALLKSTSIDAAAINWIHSIVYALSNTQPSGHHPNLWKAALKAAVAEHVGSSIAPRGIPPSTVINIGSDSWYRRFFSEAIMTSEVSSSGRNQEQGCPPCLKHHRPSMCCLVLCTPFPILKIPCKPLLPHPKTETEA